MKIEEAFNRLMCGLGTKVYNPDDGGRYFTYSGDKKRPLKISTGGTAALASWRNNWNVK